MAKPKLALIPAAQGSKLFSVLPSSGVGDFDFTRSGSATRINSQGLIETVGNGVSRLNYPMIDGKVVGCPHHLLEPPSTNLQTYSSNLAFVYVPTDVTQTSNYGISPDGTQTSTRVVLDNLSTSRSVETLTGVLVNGTTYTFSCYYKGIKGETTYMYFLSSAGGTNISKKILFNGKWQRESITFTAGSASNYTYIFDTRQGSSTATDFEVWGGQVEAKSFPTSYIPTNGSSVTRSAETANGSGDAATFNDSEGVLMIETSALADDGTFKNFSLSDGTTSNLISIIFTNTNVIRIDFTNQATLFDNTTDITNVNKISLSYKLNEVKLYVNGFLKDTDTQATMPTGLNTLRFDNTIGAPLYSKTKQVQYYNSALTDSELEKISSWTSFTDMANGQLYTIQ